jgi:hypothetical protein
MVQNHVKVTKQKPFATGAVVKKVFYELTSLVLLLVTRETIDARGTPTSIRIRRVNIEVNVSLIISNNV